MTPEQRDLLEQVLDRLDALEFMDAKAVLIAGLITQAAIKRAQIYARAV